MRGFLRSIWNAPAIATTARTWRDWVAVGLFSALVLVETAYRFETATPAQAAGQLAVGAATLALVPTLLWRRTRPFTMLLIAFTGGTLSTVLLGQSLQLVSTVFLLALPFAVLRWGSGRAAIGGIGVLLASVLADAVRSTTPLGDAIAGFSVGLGVMGLAAALRFRAAARARELESAASREREHLARDLHDSVAHHVSAIAIRAQAGLAADETNPLAATEALRLIEGEASKALVEMRSLVRELRKGEVGDRSPGAGLAELRALETRADDVPRVRVAIADDATAISTTVASAIYRIARESLTNARRHARHASLIEIQVSVAEGSAILTVHDDGVGTKQGVAGFGIVGMAERSALLGGECSAGPAAGGGWTVRAALPTTTRAAVAR